MGDGKSGAVYAPPSLSVKVQCNKGHKMTGLFVILRMAVAGPPSSIDVAADVATQVPGGAATDAPDPTLLAQFVCTIVDGNGFLQPVHDGNPWHWIFGHDPPAAKPVKGGARKSGDVARISVDPDAKYVACLLRHPQPAMARALTAWLNSGQDPDGYGFAGWTKARSSPLSGETSLGGRELLAQTLAVSTDSSKGTQLLVTVSEDVGDFLPPKFDAYGGWLLYKDMPHGSCDPVVTQVTTLQQKLGLLRFPLGGEENPYVAAKGGNLGIFDGRTVSAVHTFQEHAGRGEAFQPAAWPPGNDTASDGKHDWWFAIGQDTTVAQLSGVIPGCCDQKTWAAIDAWLAAKVCKRAFVLVKNPATYMRTDAALAVIAWKRLCLIFGVDYPTRDDEERQLASGYSLADYSEGLGLPIAHPHKTGHALDFGVVIDSKEDSRLGYAISDWAHPRAAWPILMEGQWFAFRDLDLTSGPKQKLDQAKKDQQTKQKAQADKLKAEQAAQKTLDDATQAASDADQPLPDPPDPDPKKAAAAAAAWKKKKTAADAAVTKDTTAHDKAVAAREKADADLQKANDTVDQRQKDYDAAKAKEDAAKSDPKHLFYTLICRLYAHSSLDFFGDMDGAFDKLYQSVNGMTQALSAELVKGLGAGAPTAQAEAYFDAGLQFLMDWQIELTAQIGPPEARNAQGRALLRSKVTRQSVKPWNYNPYSASGGSPGAPVQASSDTAPMDYENTESSSKRNVPPNAKSFVNLTYLGWKCYMRRISNGSGRDPGSTGKTSPTQTMGPMPVVFGRLVGLIDRIRRPDSDEKTAPIVCKPITHTADDLDVDFMLRWAKALAAMRPSLPRGSKAPVIVRTTEPQVIFQVTASDDAFAQLQTVFSKLDESGANQFVLIDFGKEALIDPAIIADSGKPGLTEGDKGKFDSGKAWKEKLENVATLFKDKVAPANVPPEDKTPGAKKKPVTSQKRDPKDFEITLQPVFEKVAPKTLAEVAFQPDQNCTMPTPGKGEQLEWWHYQHESSADIVYQDMLAQIGYWPDFLWQNEAPETDSKDGYNGRGMGGNPVQKGRQTLWGKRAKEIENGADDIIIGLTQ